MNILYLADPNSLHDVRWVNFFACRDFGIRCFILPRRQHQKTFDRSQSRLSKQVLVLPAIDDPSTIRPWKSWYQAYKIKKLIKVYNIDVLHILYAEPNALWANWRRYFNVPVIITTRGTDILKTIPDFSKHKNLFSKIIFRQYKKAFNNADYITCTSIKQMQNLEMMTVRVPTELIRTGVDFTLIERPAKDVVSTLKITLPFVLMPRNMKPLYNHEFTLAAIALLDDAIKRRFTFVFVNSDTQDLIYFEKISKRAEAIDANILFLPSLQHDEIVGLYKEAALIVMNPLSDGSPVTAMEAMACKVPVILPPLVYDTDLFDQAFSFDEWTPQSLKTAMLTVLSASSAELQAQTELGSQNIRVRGNSETEMRKLAKIYNALYPK